LPDVDRTTLDAVDRLLLKSLGRPIADLYAEYHSPEPTDPIVATVVEWYDDLEETETRIAAARADLVKRLQEKAGYFSDDHAQSIADNAAHLHTLTVRRAGLGNALSRLVGFPLAYRDRGTATPEDHRPAHLRTLTGAPVPPAAPAAAPGPATSTASQRHGL
jgi:hypothetical protein